MIKVSAVERELFEGKTASGIDFYHVPGDKVVLYQVWEHKASGKLFNDVQVSVTSTDLLEYLLKQGWLDEYKIVDVVELG